MTRRPNGPRPRDWMRAFVEGSEAVDPPFPRIPTESALASSQPRAGFAGANRGPVYELVRRMLARLDYGRASSVGGRQTLSRASRRGALRAPRPTPPQPGARRPPAGVRRLPARPGLRHSDARRLPVRPGSCSSSWPRRSKPVSESRKRIFPPFVQGRPGADGVRYTPPVWNGRAWGGRRAGLTGSPARRGSRSPKVWRRDRHCGLDRPDSRRPGRAVVSRGGAERG